MQAALARESGRPPDSPDRSSKDPSSGDCGEEDEMRAECRRVCPLPYAWTHSDRCVWRMGRMMGRLGRASVAGAQGTSG